MLHNKETTHVGAIHVEQGERAHSNLDYTILLDVVPRRGRPEIAGAVRDIIAESDIKLTPKSREALAVIVANLYAAWATRGNPFLVVPMRSSDYAPGARLRALWLTFKASTGAIHALHKAGHIELHKGFFFETKKRLTRIRAKASLVALFIKHRFRLNCIEPTSLDPVQLRKHKENGVKGASVNISRGKHAATALPFKVGVERINTALKNTTIELRIDEQTFIDHYVARPNGKKPITPPHPFRNRLYRVFNVTFSQGGRFYGHWVQGLPRELRRHVLMNGEPVVELDYKAIHPNLLYAERGEVFEGEVYLPPSYPEVYRPVFKLLMLAAINAKNTKGAIMGVRHCIRFREDLRHDFPECLKDNWLYPAFEALKDMHNPIGHYFFTGIGLRLQRTDSEIAERVMLALLANHLVAVPIHDSFLVSHQHEAALREAMLTASRDVCGRAIPVDKKAVNHHDKYTEITDEIWKQAPVMDGMYFPPCDLPPTAFEAFSSMDDPDTSPAWPNRRREKAA